MPGTPTHYVNNALAAATDTNNPNGTPGSDRCLIVTAGYSGTATTCTATYNSVSMTQLWNKRDDLNLQSSVGFRLVAPATGLNAVDVTLGAAVDLVAGGSLSLTGVDQTTSNRTVYTANETAGAAATVTVVDSQSGDLVVDELVSYSGAITCDGSQTIRAEDDAIAGGGTSYGMSSESASGGNTVMSWTATTGLYWAMGATALVPASGAAASPCGLLLLGAGKCGDDAAAEIGAAGLIVGAPALWRYRRMEAKRRGDEQ